MAVVSIQQIAFGGFWSKVKDLLSELGALAAAVGKFLLEFFTSSNEISSDISTIIADAQELKASLEREVQALKDFEFDPQWKTRVINVPKAIDQIKALVEKIAQTFGGKFQQILQPFKDLHTLLQQEAAPDPLGDKPSALVQASVKYGHIVVAVHSLATAMDDIKDMASLFEELTNDIKTLDTIFLQQGNSRERQPPDAKRPFIRVGKLHKG